VIRLSEILSDIRTTLADHSDTPGLDAQVLIAQSLAKPRSWVLAHPEAVITDEQQAIIQANLTRLKKGEPLPYVLGHWEFYGLDFLVTADTLIPRPETELLIDHALGWLRDHPSRRSGLDIGTGSGCIAISLARHIPDLRIIAVDLSFPALIIARQNALQHGVLDQIDFIQADLVLASNNRFDLLCANLPYIPSDQLVQLKIYGKEPRLALDGGPSGLDLIRRLIEAVPNLAAAGGLILFEIESSQGEPINNLASSVLPNAEVKVHIDLAKRDRLVSIQLP
jgi:release factor glutamine methyltransferase